MGHWAAIRLDLGRRRVSETGSRSWGVKSATSSGLTRSRVRPISHKWSLTADLADHGLHRRSPVRVRSQADLPGAADRSVDLSTRTRRSRRTSRERRPGRTRCVVRTEICRVWEQNFFVYRARRVWLQLNREGVAVARYTVARLMRAMGLRGAVRGRIFKVTTRSVEGAERAVRTCSGNGFVGVPKTISPRQRHRG